MEPKRNKCSGCGHHLEVPAVIYRHQADGTWAVVKDINLSSLIRRPLSPRWKLLGNPALAILAFLFLLGVFLNVWFWRMRTHSAHRESTEIADYLTNPVGTITPEFELQFERSVQGGLQASGRSNLPDGTELEIQIHTGTILVAMDYPVVVSAGQFRTRTLLSRGKPFDLAAYQVQIHAGFARRWQPPAVLLVVGNLGERLAGPSVVRTNPAQGAEIEFTQDFVLDH